MYYKMHEIINLSLWINGEQNKAQKLCTTYQSSIIHVLNICAIPVAGNLSFM